ncbi:MAG: hypothetical protein AB2A00_35010 [Myxococcota bacterium]
MRLNRVGILGSVLALAVALGAPTVVRSADVQDWRVRMEQLAATLSRVLLDLSSAARFNAPGNRERVLHDVETLANLAHDLERKDKPQADPAMDWLLQSLRSDAREAQSALREGHTAYARAALLNVAEGCISCHSRNDEGVMFPSLTHVTNDPTLTPLEHATLLAATRRFQDALARYRVVLARGLGLRETVEWQQTSGTALALAVRSLRSPELALELTDAIQANPSAPSVMHELATAWRGDLFQWSNEPPVAGAVDHASTLLDRAESLLERARVAEQRGPVPGVAWVQLLRSSTLLHDVINATPQDTRMQQEAFHLLGQAYELLGVADTRLLHPRYYEACVKVRPATGTARECLVRHVAALRRAYALQDVEAPVVPDPLDALPQRITLFPDEVQRRILGLWRLTRQPAPRLPPAPPG